MHTLPISLILILAFNVCGAQATAPETFTQGLESFKKSDFTQSRSDFSALLKQHPKDPTLLYNLGLVELGDNHPGRALAYWRKALYIKPGFSPSIAGISRLVDTKALPQFNVSPLMWIYWRIPMAGLLGASLILFVLAGVFWARHAGRKKFGGVTSIWPPLVTALAFIGVSVLAAHDYWLLHKDTKATVMDASVPVYSSPSLEAPTLFDFHEGDEVVVRRQNGDWVHVQKSATSVGWMRKEQVYIHSGT